MKIFHQWSASAAKVLHPLTSNRPAQRFLQVQQLLVTLTRNVNGTRKPLNTFTTTKKPKNLLKPDAFCDFKVKSRWWNCSKLVQWGSDHNNDGSTEDWLLSNGHAPINAGSSNSLRNDYSTLSFHMIQDFSKNDSCFGRMVDSEAPYSAIRVADLWVLRSSLGLQVSKTFWVSFPMMSVTIKGGSTGQARTQVKNAVFSTPS